MKFLNILNCSDFLPFSYITAFLELSCFGLWSAIVPFPGFCKFIFNCIKWGFIFIKPDMSRIIKLLY